MATLKKKECPLAPALTAALGGALQIQDCGHLPAVANAPWIAGHACVLEAQRAGRAYRISMDMPSYDSMESAGIVSRGAGGKTSYVQRTSLPLGSWKMRADLRVTTCTRVEANDQCTPSVGNLCLRCVDASGFEKTCEKLETF